MAIALSLVMVPVGVLFLFSGLIVNLIQAVCFIVIRPFSKSTYRKINRVVAELLWIQLIWLVDWWAGLKVRVYSDSETFSSMGKEHALVICNHRSDIDWLVGWILAQRSGCLGSALAVMKKSSKYLPVIGWSMWFNEYLFLERNWAKDENTLKSGLQRLKDYPRPFWLALFVEGTRFTPAKLLAAQEYAASQGLAVPRNVLIPRTKGFVAAVNNMRAFVPAIYDCTVTVPKDQPSPTMLRILNGQSSVVVIFWASILSYTTHRFVRRAAFLSTWKGVGFAALGALTVMLVMHIFILYSQAERSTSAKAARAKTEGEQQAKNH